MPENCAYHTVESCLAESVFLLASEKVISALHKVVDALPLQIQALTNADLSRVFQLLNKYQDRRMDFADAALVALAERMNIKTILTTDKRDFGIYRPKHTTVFELIP
jgi:predicted nucleic acid-binding protein